MTGLCTGGDKQLLNIKTMLERRLIVAFKSTIIAVMVISALSCTKKPVEGPEKPEQVRIPINISMGLWSKVTDDAYEPGDRTGVYVVNYTESGEPGVLAADGNHIDNMRFTYSGSWTPDQEIYWQDKTTKADFYCYYPYGESEDVSAYPFSAQADQSSIENYRASEFLWGKATGVSPTAEAVPIITNRLMSNMLIWLKPGEGFTGESFALASKEVRICNVKTGATVDLSTGIMTAAGAGGEVVPYDEGDHYRALLVPQTVDDGQNLITVSVDGIEYTFAKGFTFEPNVQHKFTITVNRTGGGVDITIGGWEPDDEDHGGSAE